MEHHITISYKARYFQSGEITKDTKQIWFVLHGYGQLAKYFIKKFSILQEYGICIVAPEGLSRFYTENIQNATRKSDRVGATWMTKEDRLTDIENYTTYLNNIYKEVIGTHNIPVTVLGFSQGAATASRWVAEGTINFNRLIFWAGILPPDMDFEAAKEVLKNKECIMIFGTQDPFLNDSRFTEMNSIAAKLGIKPEKISFDGAHEIDEKTLLKFI